MSARRALAVSFAFALLASMGTMGCADVPVECSDEALAPGDLEARAERTFAPAAVRGALAKLHETREAVAKERGRFALLRNYDDVKARCAQATQLADETRKTIDEAKKRKASVDALQAKSEAAMGAAEAALVTGRALLDAVPQAALDERLRGIHERHRSASNEMRAAYAHMKGSGFTASIDSLTKHEAALSTVTAEAKQAVLDIRRSATSACTPAAVLSAGKKTSRVPLFIGPGRARAHDGFAIVEAGGSEEQPTGWIVVVTRTEGGCRTVYALRSDAADALDSSSATLRTWSIDGAISARLLFAWRAPRAWFIHESGGRWSFDAAKVVGFAGKCGGVVCTEPAMQGDHIDVTCTCDGPVDANELDLSRAVRFSWHGNAVLAER